jgi:hypothetical protein
MQASGVYMNALLKKFAAAKVSWITLSHIK